MIAQGGAAGLTASVSAWLPLAVAGVALLVPWVTYTTQRRLEAHRFLRERRADGYVRLISLLQHAMAMVDKVHPLTPGRPPGLAALSDAQRFEISAEVAAFGSRDVQIALSTFYDELRQFTVHAEKVGELKR